MTEPTALALLRDTEAYLSALHVHVARHDNIGADLTCGGCLLRDRIAAALPQLAAPVPSADQTADRAAILTEAERTMLTYALDQAQEKIWSEDGFTDEDQAAVDSPRRMADEADAIASCPGYETSPNPCRCPCYGCKHHCGAHDPAELRRLADEAQPTRDGTAASLARVRALHVPDENGNCRECHASFDPCPTIAAIDGGTSFGSDEGVYGRDPFYAAAEAPTTTQPETQPESCAHCGKPIRLISGTLTAWWVHDPGGNTICNPERAAGSPRATPGSAAGVGQDGAQP